MQEFLTNYHLPSLLKASWQAAVLILLVLAVQWAFGRRLSPRWRYGLWFLVVARLALPWTMPSPVSVFNWLSLPRASAVIASPRAASEAPGTLAPRVAAAAAAQPRDAAAGTPAATAPGFSLNLSYLLLAWAAGALALAVCLVIAHYRLWRRVAPRRPLIDARVLNLLEDCKQAMGLRVPVTLVETPVVGSPSLFGFVRPRLLLPVGLTRDFSQEELRYVFLHELSHLKRQDILTGWLMTALQILHWFNPLVWLAFHRMREDRELACDALALSYAEEGENQPYGRTIIKLLERFGRSTWAPSMAGTVENKNQMKERISMIAKFHKTDRGLALAVALLAGLALVTLTDAQSQAQPQPPKIGEPDASKGVWVVKFEPVGDFSPQTPGEFLGKIHIYSGQDGEIGYFRTTKQGDKLVGSFLASDGDQLKAALDKVPGLKVTSVEKLTQEQLVEYEKSPQESLIDFNHLDASKGVWAVRFEPVGDFSPQTPVEFLRRIHIYSGQDGEIGYFRTTKQGDKLIGSFLAYDGDRLKAALAKVPGLKVTAVEKLTQEQLVEYEKSPQESLSPPAAEGPAPSIVATSPAVGATDVDPGLSEITVTFDQDMGRGMSWTGGGPEFPPALEGREARWRDMRTCVLPVKLAAAHFYRVGINSTSYQNFRSVHGVAALPSAIFFTTEGASDELKAKTMVPQAVRFDPPNGAQNVSPAVTELRITFNVPMGGGFSWCTVSDDGADFPKGREGKGPSWTGDKKTCVLPVELKPAMTYRLSLNAPEYKNFQSAGGVPLPPVEYTFQTSAK